MARLVYGSTRLMIFSNFHEVYETIGILTAQRYSRIKIEQNQLSGAWGVEGRILIYSDPHKFLSPVSSRFTAGTGNILFRVNCNSFIEDLIISHGFRSVPISSTSTTADVIPPSYNAAINLIPTNFHQDFDRGYYK
ncbi:MAG: hypothetical protein RBQ97_03760 [Acholeplasma sp.]|nr:hypothetical protein [Acholeplasma sp.]